jgi:hypothetical protein
MAKHKKKHKKHRKRNKDDKITFGKGLAAGGEISSTVGVWVSWIVAVILWLGGLYFIALGIAGRTPLFDSGSCELTDNNCSLNSETSCNKKNNGCQWNGTTNACESGNNRCEGVNEATCKSLTNLNNGNCKWYAPSRLTGETRVIYCLIGIAMIAFGVGIIFFARWWKRKVHSNKNLAAFAGGATAADILGRAFRG